MTKDKVALINSRSPSRFQFLQNAMTDPWGMMIRLGILILCVSGCLASNSAGSLGPLPEPGPRRLGPGTRNQVPFNPIYIPVAETPVSQSIEPFIGSLNPQSNRGNGPQNLMQLPNGPNVPFPGGIPRLQTVTGGTQATGVPVINFNDFISLIRHGTVSHSGSGPFNAGQDLTYINLGSLIPNAPEVAIPSNSLPLYLRGNSGTSVSQGSTHIVRSRQSVGPAQIPSLSQSPSLGSLSSALSNINRVPGVPFHPIAALHQAHALRAMSQSGIPQHPAARLGGPLGGMPTGFNSFPNSANPIHSVIARHGQQHIENAIRQSLSGSGLSGSGPLTGPLHPAILRSLSNAAPSLPRVPFHPSSILNAIAPQAMGSNTQIPALNRLPRFNDRHSSSSTTSFVHHQSRFTQVPNLATGHNSVSARNRIFRSGSVLPIGSRPISSSGNVPSIFSRRTDPRNGQRMQVGPGLNIPLTARRGTPLRAPVSGVRNRGSPNSSMNPRLSVNRVDDFVRRSSFDDFIPRSPLTEDRQFPEDAARESRFLESRRLPVSRDGFSDPDSRDPSFRFNQMNFPSDQFDRRENVPFDNRPEFTRGIGSQRSTQNVGLPSIVDERIQEDFIRDNFALPKQFDPDFSGPFDSRDLGSDSRNTNPIIADRRSQSMQPLSRGANPSFIPGRFSQPFSEDLDLPTPIRRLRGRPSTNPVNDIGPRFFQPPFTDGRRFQIPRLTDPANDIPRPIGIAIPPNQVTRDPTDSNVNTFRRGPSFDNRRFVDDRNIRFSPENRFMTPRETSRPNFFPSRNLQPSVTDDRRFLTPTRATSSSLPRPIGIALPRQRNLEQSNTGVFGRRAPFNGRDFNDVRENRFGGTQNFGFGPETSFLPPTDISSPPFIPSRVLQPPFSEDPQFQDPGGRNRAPFSINGMNDVPRPIGIAIPSNRASVQPTTRFSPNVGRFTGFIDQGFGDLGMRPDNSNRFVDRSGGIQSPSSRFDPRTRLDTRFDDPRNERFGFGNIFDQNNDRFDPQTDIFDPENRFDDRRPIDDRRPFDYIRPFDDRRSFDDRRRDDPFGDAVDFFNDDDNGSFTPFFQPRFPTLISTDPGSRFSISPVSREMTRFFQRSPGRRPRGSFLISFLVNVDDVTGASDEIGFDVNSGIPRGFQNRFIPRDPSSPFRVNGPMGEDINRLEERDIFENERRNDRNNFVGNLPRIPSRRFPGRNDGFNDRAARPFIPRDTIPRDPFTPPMAPPPASRIFPQDSVDSFQPRSFSQPRIPIDTNRQFFSRSQPIGQRPVPQTQPPPQPFALAIPDPDGPRNRPFLTAAVQGQFDGPTSNININDAFNRRQPGFTFEPVVPFPRDGFDFNQPTPGRSQISPRNNIPNVQHLLNLGNSVVHSQTQLNIPTLSGNVGGRQRPLIAPVNTSRGGPLSTFFNLRGNSNFGRNAIQSNDGILGVQSQGNPSSRSVFRHHRQVTHSVNSGGPTAINPGQLYVSKKAFGRYE